ncbi:amino acid ABC transporter substrate-binding protein [Levilactobacillus zymae]|uniref:Amino acid ABC transporter substrate-binding protein n=1 Tax=Levilactobacillus zymae TaxID=267363 RepID=A0ABQ0WXH4_9LACO|nr:transporter substrate-binding domain-containing protein [Levilactobacillus zymae]KRL16323.1 ABC superfamily ATP binding cassette transporter substrate binding protein [Levilactobacillus zymae DSM 19395]QFR61917.1 transporter substrate-binding domain-containing protein [Levilactobacillus zymae]GEO72600.1 amino acid ABC transporter substrate-binding protein [Levilactobacillus zymae]
MKSKKRIIVYGVIAIAVIILILTGALHNSSKANSNSSVTTISVAGPDNNRPYTYPDNGKIGGYYGALLGRIDQDLKQYKFKQTTTAQNSVFVGLQSGKYDLAVSNWWYSKDRFNTYLHSTSNGLDDLRLITKKGGKTANSLKDIATKKLTLAPISTDDARYAFIQDYNKKNPKYKINLKGIGDQSAGDALKQVSNGQYDVAIYPYAAYKPVSSTSEGTKLRVSKSIGLENSYFLLNKSDKNEKLLKALNKELKKLKDNGYLGKITKKYLYENTFEFPGANSTFNTDPTK